jgi:YggT family protein
MFLFRNLIIAFADVLHIFLSVYTYVVIASAVVSWFNINPNHQVVQFIHRITEPPLAWIRKTIPVVVSGLDLSPVLLIFTILFLDHFIVETLRQLAVLES